jgi:hypothetical protein
VTKAPLRKRVAAALRTRVRVDPRSWRGAARALRSGAIGVLAVLVAVLAFSVPALERTIGLLAVVALLCLAAILAILVAEILRGLPRTVVRGALFLGAVLAALFVSALSPTVLAIATLAIVIAVALLGGSIAAVRASGWRFWPAVGLALSGSTILATLVAFGVRGWHVEPSSRPQAVAVEPLRVADPGVPGPYRVTMFTYGSGEDRHRDEYGAGATLTTDSVDGSAMIDGWDGGAGWLRTRYWGFDATALPIQGRGWLPRSPNDGAEGDGPYPLVLIVHGNHDMEDFSDVGYAYLGQLFASRGFITVSVDENFLNSSLSDLVSGPDGGLDAENDARGWLLLEHLERFRRWNAAPGNALHGKVDLERIVLIGHSRGGEAVAEAQLFNRVGRYPDDATLVFPRTFGIEGLIAIAPSDGQYDPRGRPTTPSGVSYLVVQGSLDGDVQSFSGAAQYARLALAPCTTCFKSAIYVVGANHGQFNTSWGRDDIGFPWGNLLNLAPIIDAQVQRHVAQVLFTAFLEAVLHDDPRYRALFADPERGRSWLGAPELIARYEDGDDRQLAGFEEDSDVETGTASGVHLDGATLATWREEEIALKWDDLDSEAAVLGWTTRDGDTARYVLRLDTPAELSDDRALAFDLAMSEESPYEDDAATDWQTPDAIDFTVTIVDADGREARRTLAEIALLAPPVVSQTRKASWLDPLDQSEPVFRRYAFDATTWRERNPEIDLARITAIRLDFDATPAGTVLLDNVAIARRR